MKASRRQFLAAVGGTVPLFLHDEEDEEDHGWFGLDEDGDGDYLDDILGLDDEEATEGILTNAEQLQFDRAVERHKIDFDDGVYFIATDSGAIYKPGANQEPLKIPSTGDSPSYKKYNNVHVVKTADDLYDLFPDVTDGTWTQKSKLEDRDLVKIDAGDSPIRHELDLRVESVVGVVVEGSGRGIDLKPADGVNAGEFVFTSNSSPPERITFRDIGYDGNKDEMTGGQTPFITNWTCDDFHVINCHAQFTYPYHVHNGGGTAIVIKNAAERPVIRDCTFDNVGDRSIGVNSTDFRLVGNTATNGFDRMITMARAQRGYVAGNVSIDTVEGSAFGVNDGSTEASEHITFVGNWGIGDIRNLYSFEGNQGAGVNYMTVIGGGKIPDPATATNNRNTIHEQNTGRGHKYIGIYGENNVEAGYEIRHDDVFIDYLTEVSPGTYGVQVVSGTDVEIGRHYDIQTPGTDDFDLSGGTRPVLAGVGLEDLGVSPTSAPTGAWREGTEVRNNNADNNEMWKLARGVWVQVA